MSAVLGFYKFVDIPDPTVLADTLRAWGEGLGLLGTVLLAGEGINGSVSGEQEQLRRWRQRLGGIPAFADMDFTVTTAGSCAPFYKFRVRHKREIIPLRNGGIRPLDHKLNYLDARQWNDLLDDPQALIIDVRNAFEYRLGHFSGATSARLKNFSQFAGRLRTTDAWSAYRRVGMYCTGGIRCEKAAALWQTYGDAEVWQLQGGIVRYLQTVSPSRNAWRGDCFVFDHRVSLNRDLQPGKFSLCFGCGEPLSESEREDPRYCYGVSCPYCSGKRSPGAIAASQERLHQIELARLRGRAAPARSLIGYCASRRPSRHGG